MARNALSHHHHHRHYPPPPPSPPHSPLYFHHLLPLFIPTKVRDLGTLLIHVGRQQEGLGMLTWFQTWLEFYDSWQGGPAGEAAKGAQAELVAEVVLAEQKRALEMAFGGDSGGAEQGPIEILPADD